MLKIRGVTKVYGSGTNTVTALNNVSVDFGSKGLIIVLGKSGCGKSTMLNILGGLDKPTFGEVIINGQSTANFKAGDFDAYRNTYVGIVFQEFNLIDEISVYENIDMTLKLQEKTADVNTVEEALSLVGLSNLGYRKPVELSGGQRQRVALARALLKKPEIILADEPTGSLDTATSEDVFESLKKISETKLVIIVTHERELANKYGDRVIEMVDGSIVADRVKTDTESGNKVELCDNVIQISSGAKVEKADFNGKFASGEVNYIGLSHDKERIALAYPETVDCFYGEAGEAKYRKTAKTDIVEDGKPFKLSKGRLPLKEAIKMARQNIKRTKKKYKFVTRIAIVCFTFLTLAFIIGTSSISSLAAASTFEKDGLMIASAIKTDKNVEYVRQQALNAEDFKKIQSIVGGKVGKSADIFLTPSYANRKENNNGISPDSYVGVIEDATPSDLDLKMKCGVETLGATDEIIISDFSAIELLKNGYIGFNNAGEYGLYFPKTEQDLVGAKIQMKQTEKYYKIVGIFKTDFENYKDVIAGNVYDPNMMQKQSVLSANISFLYAKVFAANGFCSKFLADTKNYDNSRQFVDIMMYNRSTDMSVFSGSELGQMSLSKADVEKNPIIWTASGSPIAKLNEKEIVVEKYTLQNLLGLSKPVETITDDVARAIKEASVKLEIRSQGVVVLTDEFKIVGVSDNWGCFLPDSFISLARSSMHGFNEAYFSRGLSSISLGAKFDQLYKESFIGGTAKVAPRSVAELKPIMAAFASTFFWVAVVMLVFILIVLFNYMATSVKFRSKEVAVYRVVGAKSLDVSKIFFAEGFFITLKTTIWASIFSFALSYFINNILSAILWLMGVGFNIITFNFILHPLFIFVVCAIFVFVCTIIPISNITRKSPAVAVRMI